MATVIKAGNNSTGAQVSSDNTGILELKTGTGAGTTAMTVGTDQSVTFAQAANLPNTFGFKNRIINGAMVIDQRNAGASVTASDTTNAIYITDRWAYRVLAASKISLQRSTVAPAGFTNSLLVTSLSAYTIGTAEFLTVRQPIEGFNVADLGWGAAGASSIILSFQARSSLTGTFGGYVSNASADRFYVFSYTINSANTWETKTVTIAGDTSGTWNTSNGIGLMLGFSVASGSGYQGSAGSWGASTIVAPTGQVNLAGTNGATFYITGVQLEKGSTATSFDYRPYGTELALCQRYFVRQDILGGGYMGLADSTTASIHPAWYGATMRAAPTFSYSGTFEIRRSGIAASAISAIVASNPTNVSTRLDVTTSGLTAGQAVLFAYGSGTPYLTFSAEL